MGYESHHKIYIYIYIYIYTSTREDYDESFDLQPPVLKYGTYQEAVCALEYVQAFLDSKGHNKLATMTQSVRVVSFTTDKNV